MQGDMGWKSSKHRRILHMIRFWNRIVNLDNNRLVKRIFLWDFNIKEKNWCSELEEVLDDVNLLHNFQHLLPCDVEYVDRQLTYMNQCKWLDRCESMPKLRTYIKFKSEYCAENYVEN